MLCFARLSQFDSAQLNCAVYCWRNFIENHTKRFTVWRKTVHTLFRQVLLISEWHLQIFDFESKETNPTHILRKLWFATIQIGVESVKGKEGTFTYQQAYFLPLVFENSNKFNCDFWPLCTFTDRILQTRGVDTFWCMQWHQEVMAELIALHFIKFH